MLDCVCEDRLELLRDDDEDGGRTADSTRETRISASEVGLASGVASGDVVGSLFCFGVTSVAEAEPTRDVAFATDEGRRDGTRATRGAAGRPSSCSKLMDVR